MPRKNARPAARKLQRKLSARLAKKAVSKRRLQPYLAQPRFGDAAIVGAILGCTK